MARKMAREGRYSINFVLSKARTDVVKRESSEKIDGINVFLNSDRYATFKQSGTKCVCCGLEGKFFGLERTLKERKNNTNRCHFNLYGVDKRGEEVLFTKDHILPKAKGGKDHISNYQTMCCVCNNLKGSDGLTIEEISFLRQTYNQNRNLPRKKLNAKMRMARLQL